MAIPVSQPFKDAVDDRQKIVVIEEIRLKRRKKAAGFPYEAGEIILEEDEFKAISPITKKFDVQKQNKILTSNVTITLDNALFQWDEFNTTNGRWKKDGASLSGYDPYLSEWTIIFGVVTVEDPDATPETIQVFIGRMTSDMIQDTQSGNVQITLRGFEIKLQGVDSQKVNTLLTDVATTPAVGDGSNPDFELAPSLFDVQKLRTDTVIQAQGTNYRLTQVGSADVDAKATFQPGFIPGVGAAVDFTARQWKRNLSVSEYLGLVCDAGGITPANRSIIEPSYPEVNQFIDYGSQAEWDAATKVGVSSIRLPGFASWGKDFDNFSFIADLSGWTVTTNVVAPDSSADVVHGVGSLDGIGGSARMGLSGSAFTQNLLFFVQLQGSIPVVGEFRSGTFKDLNLNSGGTVDETIINALAAPVRIHFIIYNSATGSFAILSSDESTKAHHTINFKYSSSFAITLPEFFGWGASVDAVVGKISTPAGTVLTDEINLGVLPTDLSPILVTATLNGGTVSQIRTQSSILSGGPFSALTVVDGSNVPLSPLRQFWKVELTLTSDGGENNGPDVDLFRFQFASTELLLGHADTTQKDGLQAAQRLAEITGSEFGFDNLGKFFFRPKSVSLIPIISLNEDNYILNVSPARNGYRDVKNVVQVNYGPYYSEVNSTTKGEVFPDNSQERFGDRLLPLSVNDFLFANNADFAGAIAEILFDLLSKPKRKARVTCRLIPFVDLSDVISISYKDSELLNPVYGDKLNPKPSFGPSGNVLYRDMLAKIIGVEQDFTGGRTILDIEEVLIT